MIPANKITLRVESDSSAELDGLIVVLEVRSGTKNPYHILFPKTDQQGIAELTRDDFIGQFMDHFEMGVMDYNGSIETAEPTVRVSLFDPTWSIHNKKFALAWPLLKHESTKWKSRKEVYNYRISCRNLEFTASPLEVDLESTNSIKLKVVRRAAA